MPTQRLKEPAGNRRSTMVMLLAALSLAVASSLAAAQVRTPPSRESFTPRPMDALSASPESRDTTPNEKTAQEPQDGAPTAPSEVTDDPPDARDSAEKTKRKKSTNARPKFKPGKHVRE